MTRKWMSVWLVSALASAGAWAATLQNPDFEVGGLSKWDVVADQLTVEAATNETFNRNCAARIHGSYSGDGRITNSISQNIPSSAGDILNAVGFIYWKSNTTTSAAATGTLEIALEGPLTRVAQTWTAKQDSWVYFDLTSSLFGLNNPGFEMGATNFWQLGADHLPITIDGRVAAEGAFSLRMAGTWTNGWSFNQAYQVLHLYNGDVITARAKINAKTLQASATNGWIAAGIKLEEEGTGFGPEAALHANVSNTGWTNLEFTTVITNEGWFVFRCMVAGDSKGGENFCDVNFDEVRLSRWPVGVYDGGFESGEGYTNFWGKDSGALTFGIATNLVSSGSNSLRMSGGWSGWNWNQVYQVVHLRTGDVVRAGGRIYLDKLDTTAGWLVAGIKLEKSSGGSGFEHVYDFYSDEDTWQPLGFTAVITNAGEYVFRCMVCGDSRAGQTTNDVYFDDITLTRDGQATGEVVDVTLKLTYSGFSGGATNETTTDIYLDSLTVDGSTANIRPVEEIFTELRGEAGAIAAAPAMDDVPKLIYPPIYTFGYPGGDTNVIKYPSHIEALVAGWRFRYLTNDVVLTVTNSVICYPLGGAGPGFMELDQYQYCSRNWSVPRGTPVTIHTNPPYFMLGAKDGSSAEFGDGPFPSEHTYVVGDSLTNFPRRMVTHYDGRWPTKLNVVFEENLGKFDRNQDKYFVLTTLASNGPASNAKAVKIQYNANDPGHTNLEFQTHEIHMGWATEQESAGKIDYPNCTYQDHNEVALRAGWLYGLLDKDGWFMNQVARGSATIEPMDLYPFKNGNWLKKTYEEYLFTWPSAASGVRSIFEEDGTDDIPGSGSYSVGFKIGHQYGTNEFGEPKYPQVIEMRGNGYFRMTDYDGVMGGSFRPVAQDVFGIFKDKEDAPLMPEAYTRLVSRSTRAGQFPDDSYVQVYLPVHSKTNNLLAGVLKVDGHFTPDEAGTNGAYIEVEADTYANKPIVASNDGPLAYFAQVDMYWRGGSAVNDYSEGHDFDAVMVKKTDGEWITHLPINPPTNIYHRTLGTLRSNDTVYLMQQDRGPYSYGFSTEAPYRKVSSFEITMLDDGGREATLDLYEQNTISEINDNIDIACNMKGDLAQGEHVRYKYRYRGLYAPGVTILNPNETCGGENWSNNTYRIDFVATDGEDRPLEADVYYGSGRDGEWVLINEGEQITVNTNTHRASYVWNASGVPAGAYYIKVAARRIEGGKAGFDVSNTRIQAGAVRGFPNNGATTETVVTNEVGYLGENMGFESGSVLGWASAGDNLNIWADTARKFEGRYAARMRGTGWSGWSWNNLQQEIPCASGEVLRVTGKVYIGKLLKTGTNWVACGVKMESTNDAGRTSAGTEWRVPAMTGLWLNVDFERTAPVSGTDRLLLFVAGFDCSGADVYFDDLKVMSTNTGLVVTNRIRGGYWEGDEPADVRGHDALSLWASDPLGASNAQVWVADTLGRTNSVRLINYVDRVYSLPRRVDIPWSSFPGIDRSNVIAMGVAAADNATVTRVRSIGEPLKITAQLHTVPQVDYEGMPHYNPGQTVYNIVTLQNTSGSALTGLFVQAIQEYGTNVMWLDKSPAVPERWSEKTRTGDRLCGDFEQVWTGVTIPAGGTVVLTNRYFVPFGRIIDHTRFAMPSAEDWVIFRNYESRAQIHVAVRDAAGRGIVDHEQAACYSIDDNFDINDNGLPDAWEIQYGGSYDSMDPDEDPDGDGFSNLAEYQGGTDPQDPLSYPGSGARYTVHLASTNGQDLFPRATAERSNYTGAASCWMIARYLNGESFGQSQTEIYNANTFDAAHNSEITPQSCASWMWQNIVPGYFFSARSRTNLLEALRESVYWMDYVPAGGKKTPVYILSGTNWSYKVMRGFQTDVKPYDGGFGVTPSGTFTVYGAWINDPRVSGLGYDVYAAAGEMAAVYSPSESDGRYSLVAEPPQDAEEMAEATGEIDRASISLAPSAGEPVLASYLQSLFPALYKSAARPSKRGLNPAADPPQGSASLLTILPGALREDEGFMELFNTVTLTNYYAVNATSATGAYVLAAGGRRGPGSTVYVLKLSPTNGAFQQATWDPMPSLYPIMPLEAAVWAAKRHINASPVVSDNLLLNNSFETNSGAGGVVESWPSGGSARPETWAVKTGAWGIAVAAWSGATGYFYQDYANALAGETYSFSIAVERDAGFTAAAIDLKLEWYGPGMMSLGSTVKSIVSSLSNGTWKVCSVVGEAPAGTEFLRCTVWVDGVINSGQALKFDDAQLTESKGPQLIDAQLVYDPAVDVSPFLPRWSLKFGVGGSLVTQEVCQVGDINEDSDDDGMSDRYECYAGFNPSDPNSAFGIDGGWVRVSGDERLTVSWPSTFGKTYSLQKSTELRNGFSLLSVRIPATPPLNTATDVWTGATSCYRVEVE